MMVIKNDENLPNPAEPDALQRFRFDCNEIRIVMRNGEPWWVVLDVCKVLSLRTTDAVSRLDKDEVDAIYLLNATGKRQTGYIISEPGLYNLILGSKKPEAKRFKRWVTHDVLPLIRKTGNYSAGSATDLSLVKQAELLLATTKQLATQEKRIEYVEQTAKAAFDKVESNFGCFSVLGYARRRARTVTVEEAARYGRELTRICRELGIRVDNVADPRFGRVNIYPEGVLEEYFDSKDRKDGNHAN